MLALKGSVGGRPFGLCRGDREKGNAVSGSPSEPPTMSNFGPSATTARIRAQTRSARFGLAILCSAVCSCFFSKSENLPIAHN